MFNRCDFLAELTQYIRRYGLYASGQTECDISAEAGRKAWARILAKIYKMDPYTCPKCGFEMKVLAVIRDSSEN